MYQLNYFMQGFRLKEIISLVRDPRELHASVENSRHVGSWVAKSHARSLQFTLCTPGVSMSPFPRRAFVLHSPLELSIMPSAEEWLLSSSSLADSKIWAFSTTRGRRLTFGTVPSPYSMGEERWMEQLKS